MTVAATESAFEGVRGTGNGRRFGAGGAAWAMALVLAAVLMLGPMRRAAGAERSDGAAAFAVDVPALCEKIKPAYVFISGGSGVIVRPDGLMITNAHVVGNTRNFDVRTGTGRHYKARLLGRDTVGDLAVLQLEVKEGERTAYLELGDSDSLRIGDLTIAVGNPFAVGLIDQTPTFTVGVVSAVKQAQGTYTECIITDSRINPGNSGGPLVNMVGQVVGINGQISTRWGLRSNTGLGYAISSRQIALWLPRLEKANGGTLAHGRLAGVELSGASLESQESLVVRDVGEDTPAAAAGLKSGDRIVRIDGQSVANAYRLGSILGMYPAEHVVEIVVRRGEQEIPLRARLVAARRVPVGFKVAAPGEDATRVKVSEVVKGSPAELAGVQVGDEIVAIEGSNLNLAASAQHRLLENWLRRGVPEFDVVRLKVLRKPEQGEPEEKELRFVARGSDRASPDRNENGGKSNDGENKDVEK